MADRKELKELLKKADYQVYTVLRHVSRSGMTRVIQPIVMLDGEPYYLRASVADLLDYKLSKKHDGLIVYGCGMDMGFHIVYQLSSELFGDGYKLKQRWL